MNIERDFAEIKRALAESTVLAITDEKGIITFVNDEFCRLSKYKSEELIGRDHSIVNSGYHSKEFFEELWNTIKSGKTWRGEIRNKAKDGTFYWVSTTIVPFLNNDRKPYQFIAIRHDITGQKEIERELSDHKELIEQTYDAIYTWKLDDGVIRWNKNAERLYGYTLPEVKGQKVAELLKAKYPVPFDEYFEILRRTGYWEGEIIQTTKDGRRLIVESRQALNHSRDDNPVVLETSRDITTRKKAMERIRQQASLLEQTRDAIMVCDLNHRLIYWNPGAERVYGWTAAEILGNDFCDAICNGDQNIIKSALHALETKDEWHSETATSTKSGNEIVVISRWTLVRNEFGQPDYYLVVNSDVTELKYAEMQLLRAQRLESIGTLAGGIAHDLNNSLSPIMMAVDMLQNDTDLPQTSRPWLSIIRENTERSADLIKQVLMFARGAEDGTRINLQMRHLIGEFIKILRKTFPKNIPIKHDLAPDLMQVSADPTQIHQVLMNLAINAKDALAKDGGLLEIRAENVMLSQSQIRNVSDAEPGAYVLIAVRDTGHGMSDQTLSRIWDPFFTTKAVGKGTGLGLSTALSIVEGHKGLILAESEEGVGTEISVYLPALESSVVAEQTKETGSLPRGTGETVLLVDDELDVLRVAKAALEQNGYNVLTAASGLEAIEVCAANGGVKLALTDMAMPEIDGPATIAGLLKIDPNIKIIATSGLGKDYRAHLRSIRADDFIQKPFTVEALLSVISKALSNGA